MAEVQDGTYDFIGNVLAAVRAPGVMRKDVLAFSDIARSVQRGELSNEDAATKVAEINGAFATLWKWMNENGAAVTLVLTIIGLYIAIWAKESADAGSAVAHADAQQQVQVQEKIFEALQRQHAPAQRRVEGLLPSQMKHMLSHTQRPTSAGEGNRKERRAAAARTRRHSPS